MAAAALEWRVALLNKPLSPFLGLKTLRGQRSLLLSERKNIIIGDQCLFSHTIWFRNADPHLIYDNITNKRINPTQSIYIGDHVWGLDKK